MATSASHASLGCREFAFCKPVDLVWSLRYTPPPSHQRRIRCMGRKSLEERQAEMRDRLVREKLNSIGERIVVDAVKHTPAEPLQPVLPNVNWNVVLAQSTEPEIPFAARRLPQSRRDSSTCGSGVLSWGESAHGPRVHSHGSIANSQAAISRRKRFQAANPYRCTRSPQVCRRSQGAARWKMVAAVVSESLASLSNQSRLVF